MKYKVGDRVRIKDTFVFTDRAENYVNFLKDRNTKIKRVIGSKYILEGVLDLEWQEEWIEGIYEPIFSRWEILDL